MPRNQSSGTTVDDTTKAMVISLRQAGHGQIDIASRVGLARNTVKAIIKTAGLPTGKPKAKPTPPKSQEGIGNSNAGAIKGLGKTIDQAAPTVVSSPENTALAHNLKENMQDRLADRTHKFVDTLTDNRIEEVSVPQAVNCISKLVDASVKLQKAQQDQDVSDSLTALLVHATRRQEENLTPFPKIVTVDQPPVYEDE